MAAVPVIASFIGLLQTIAAARRSTARCARIILILVSVIAALIAELIVESEILPPDPIAASSEFTAVGARVAIVNVAVVASLSCLHKGVTTACDGAIDGTAVGTQRVAVIARFEVLTDAVTTASAAQVN